MSLLAIARHPLFPAEAGTQAFLVYAGTSVACRKNLGPRFRGEKRSLVR